MGLTPQQTLLYLEKYIYYEVFIRFQMALIVIMVYNDTKCIVILVLLPIPADYSCLI